MMTCKDVETEELRMRNAQLGEIRDMLMLPRGASHRDVCLRLARIGQFSTLTRADAIPERYRDSYEYRCAREAEVWK